MAAVTEHVVALAVGLGVTGGPARRGALLDERLEGVGHRVPVGRIAVPVLETDQFADLVLDEVVGEGDARVEALLVSDQDDLAGAVRAATSSSASSTVTPIGFSTRTCLPASSALRASGTWNWSATATIDGVDGLIGEHLVVVGVGRGGLVNGDDHARADRRRHRRSHTVRRSGFAAGGKVGGLRDLSGAEDTDAEWVVSHHNSFQQFIFGVRLTVGDEVPSGDSSNQPEPRHHVVVGRGKSRPARFRGGVGLQCRLRHRLALSQGVPLERIAHGRHGGARHRQAGDARGPTRTRASNGSDADSPHTPTGLRAGRRACAVAATRSSTRGLPRVEQVGEFAPEPVRGHRVLREVVGAE